MTKGNIHILITNAVHCFLSTTVYCTKKELYLKFPYLWKNIIPYVKAPRRKEVWGSEDTNPRILNLRIEWSCLLKFTL
jgi:hypothetical protein